MEPRSLRSENIPPRMNGSSEIRQPTESEGKVPHSWAGPNRDEPSRRTLAETR